MDKKRTMGFIGICRKAGKLCCGHDAVKESVVKNRAVLVFFSSDASERLKDEMKNLAIKSTGTKLSLSPFSSDGKKVIGVFGNGRRICKQNRIDVRGGIT